WKNGRWWMSHFGSTPSGNQAPPVASVTDHRAHHGEDRRSQAAARGSTAPGTCTVRSASRTVSTGSAASTSTVTTAAPSGATRSSRPATNRDSGASAAESTTTSIGTDRPVIAARAGPTSVHSRQSGSTRTTTTPAGAESPITELTAFAQSPVTWY